MNSPKNYITAAILAGTAAGCVNDYRETKDAVQYIERGDAGRPSSDAGNDGSDGQDGNDGGYYPDAGNGDSYNPNYYNDSQLPPVVQSVICEPEDLESNQVPTKRNVIVQLKGYEGGVAAGRIFATDIEGAEIRTESMIAKNGNLEYSDDMAFYPDKDKDAGNHFLSTVGKSSIDAIAFGGFEMEAFLTDVNTAERKGKFEDFAEANGFVKKYTTSTKVDDYFTHVSDVADVTSWTLGDEIANPEFKNGAFPTEAWVKEPGNGQPLVILFRTVICNPEQAQAETRSSVKQVIAQVGGLEGVYFTA